MKEVTNDQVVMNLLEAKNSMEKKNEFASRAMRKAKAKSSLDNIKVVRLSREIGSLKAARGKARTSAAGSLAKSLLVSNKPAAKVLFCKHCGNKLASGAVFCANCGTKTPALSKSNPSRLSEFHF